MRSSAKKGGNDCAVTIHQDKLCIASPLIVLSCNVQAYFYIPYVNKEEQISVLAHYV